MHRFFTTRPESSRRKLRRRKPDRRESLRRGFTLLLTAVVWVHASLGCCCHHTHASESGCCDDVAPASSDSCCCEGHGGLQGHEEPVELQPESSLTGSHPDHGPLRCDGDVCTLAMPDRCERPLDRSAAVVATFAIVDDRDIHFLSAAFSEFPGSQRATNPAPRVHLVLGVLLI